MLGIVAGLGPRATAKFYSSLMHKVTAASQGELPRLIMYGVAMSPQIENAFLQEAQDEQAPARLQVRALLNEAVQHFVSNQVTTVAMPCNTLQDEMDALCQANGLTHLNMIDLTAQAIHDSASQRVLVLGTASTYCDDLYGQRLRQHGIECLYPDNQQQDFIETYIRFALNDTINLRAQQEFAEKTQAYAKQLGASAVVLACTDLTGDLSPANTPLKVFDSLELLAMQTSQYLLKKRELFV